MDEFEAAMEAFARGFAFTRSFTHPAEGVRAGPAWVVRDMPRRNPRDYRREEWIAAGLSAAEFGAVARANTRGAFCLCVMVAGAETDTVRADYKAGWRLSTTEPLFVHDLSRIPRATSPWPVRAVTTAAMADAVNEGAGRTLIRPGDLEEGSAVSLYAAWDGERPVGWARRVRVGTTGWIASVYTRPECRRRGVARAVLARILKDDRGRGVALSVLLSSHTGALMYPAVGYRQIGVLLQYTARR